MSNQRLWGLTLLERNIKELQILGIKEIIMATASESDPRDQFCQPWPSELKIKLNIATDVDPFESLIVALQESKELILVLEGHALNDRRVLKKLVEVPFPCAVISTTGSLKAGAAVLSANDTSLFINSRNKKLTHLFIEAIQDSKIQKLDLTQFDPYIENLRREIHPYLLLIESSKQLKEADQLLRQTVHKGVNDFVAKYIHPPLEFGAARFLTSTPITPNQITLLWIILAGITILLFANGHLYWGIFIAAACGVLDGIDGKLARLTLHFSKAGDLLDHISNTVYDALWYLALGWYFSNGDLNSTAAQFTMILFIAYIVERVVPGIFKKLHGYEIYDYQEIDKVARLIGSRMNNNVWVLMLGIIFGLAQETFYAISLWMLTTASWHTLRLFWVTWKTRIKKPVFTS
ncbi:MAG: CDP-alcohol phosphatidyltransferase family protein [bacterium]